MHKSEKQFADTFFLHNNWIYQPVVFRLCDSTYTPDFYDRKRGVFIEVCGSRQAYHANKSKYNLLEDLYPSIKLELRKPDGTLLVNGYRKPRPACLEPYRRLEGLYGSKQYVADLLGYTLRHYNDLRTGKATTPKAVELALDKLIADSRLAQQGGATLSRCLAGQP